jgi:hypothetical protein
MPVAARARSQASLKLALDKDPDSGPENRKLRASGPTHAARCFLTSVKTCGGMAMVRTPAAVFGAP